MFYEFTYENNFSKADFNFTLLRVSKEWGSKQCANVSKIVQAKILRVKMSDFWGNLMNGHCPFVSCPEWNLEH